jgi:hypothetical protein
MIILREPRYNISWHTYFSWFPMWFDEAFIWMERIERKWNPEVISYDEWVGPIVTGGWEYRIPASKLKELDEVKKDKLSVEETRQR